MNDTKQRLKPGDVLFSKEHNCKVTIHEITKDGVLCDWFTGTEHHQELISKDEFR